MAYMDDALQLCRILVGDDESPFTYCDDRLINQIIGAAKMILLELTFENDYTVNMSTLTISPDPVDDPYFIPLICLYVAVRIAGSEFKAAALSNISITDGPSNISMAGSAGSMKSRLDALTKEYQQAKLQYGVGVCPGKHFIISTLESIYSQSYVDGYFNPNLYNQYSQNYIY